MAKHRWFLGILLWTACRIQAQDIHIQQQGRDVSLRGLSVLDDQTAWASGEHGWVAHSSDRGKHWQWKQIPGQEQADFRSIYVLSDTKILLMSAGSPLLILLSEDGGSQWKTVHSDRHPDIFFDGLDFWNDRDGIAFGDPLNGHMQLLVTHDGGYSWKDLSSTTANLLATGEAGFAASGSSIRTLPGGKVLIGTGGSRAQLLVSADQGNHWDALPCPILQGQPSMGIFSIAFIDAFHGVAVGGDYQKDREKNKACLLTADGGHTWTAPNTSTNGFRSSVEYLNKDTLISCGTSGVDRSLDGGKNWQLVSAQSFHVVRKARKGSWVVLAGAKGSIATYF